MSVMTDWTTQIYLDLVAFAEIPEPSLLVSSIGGRTGYVSVAPWDSAKAAKTLSDLGVNPRLMETSGGVEPVTFLITREPVQSAENPEVVQ